MKTYAIAFASLLVAAFVLSGCAVQPATSTTTTTSERTQSSMYAR